MGRRRRRDGLAEVLQEAFLLLPWWVGPSVAGIVFVLVRLLGQTLASSENPVGRGLGPAIVNLAPFAAILVLIIWAVALCQKGYRRRLLSSRDGIESIRALSWRDFELLVGEALRREGYTVEEFGGGGADGGVDLVARRADETILVQCKHWKSWDVGVRVVREVYGVMSAEQASAAMIVTTGRFTRPARAFAEGKPLRLLDGEQLTSFVAAVQGAPSTRRSADDASRSAREPVSQDALTDPAPMSCSTTSSDTCPKCGAPMVVRTARRGANAGTQFLGCSTYPTCRGTRELPAGGT